MRSILAIDPGPERSGWAIFRGGLLTGSGVYANADVLTLCRMAREGTDQTAVVIESMESYGMPVGREVFEAVLWSGRFWEACAPLDVRFLSRRAVKLTLCDDPRAKDANVRQAVMDRFGSSRMVAIGTKHSPGPLYGVARDAWSALALALVLQDLRDAEQKRMASA